MTARVSVIVPIYNVEQYLEECLLSLVGQTMEDFQAVCVNDGATDSSREIAARFAEKDERFMLVDRENGGLSAARNTGLAAATGDYVCFLDSDDKLAPNALEMLMSVANEFDLDLIDFDADTFYETEKAKRSHEEGEEARDSIPSIMAGSQLMVAYMEKGQYYCSACFHLIRRSMLVEHSLRFKEGIIHEDELFSPMLHAYAKKAMFLNEKLYLRRVREGSIMTEKRGLRNVMGEFRVLQELCAWLQGEGRSYDEDFQNALAQRIYYLVDFIGHDARNCSIEELRNAKKSLQPAEQLLFEMLAVQHRNGIIHLRASYEDSKAYKLGNILAAPIRRLRR